MVPLDAGNNGHIGFVEVELRTTVEGRSQVLVAFDDHHLGGMREAYHHLEALELRAHHIVGLDAAMRQHMQYHGRGGRLAVRAAYHDAQLVLALLIQILKVAVYLQSKLLRLQQLRVVDAGMHTQHYGVEVFGYPLRMPSERLRQQAIFLQPALCGVEYLVVTSRDGNSFLTEGDG